MDTLWGHCEERSDEAIPWRTAGPAAVRRAPPWFTRVRNALTYL
jgi:hypothetical protein